MTEPVPQVTMTFVVEGRTYEATKDVTNPTVWKTDKRAFEFEINEVLNLLKGRVLLGEFPPPTR